MVNQWRLLNIEAYRKQFGIVQQEPVLFDMSIEENIRLGKLNATDAEVVQAATLANAHDFIMTLDAVQALQLMNTYNISEQLVQNALDKAQKGRTTLVIAHRLSTIRNVDKIVVMNKGKIVESGTHDELIKQRGFYYNLTVFQEQSDNTLDVEQ
ncbi:unnamed protein product, partial [Didymodactylos carnosus]